MDHSKPSTSNPTQSTLHQYFQFTNSNAINTPKKEKNNLTTTTSLDSSFKTPEISKLSLSSSHTTPSSTFSSPSLFFKNNIKNGKKKEKEKDSKSLLSLIPSIVSSSTSSTTSSTHSFTLNSIRSQNTPTKVTPIHPSSSYTLKKMSSNTSPSISTHSSSKPLSHSENATDTMEIDDPLDSSSYSTLPLKRLRSSQRVKRRTVISSDDEEESASDSEQLKKKVNHQLEASKKYQPLKNPMHLGLISPIKSASSPMIHAQHTQKQLLSEADKKSTSSTTPLSKSKNLSTTLLLSSSSSPPASELSSSSSISTSSSFVFHSINLNTTGLPSWLSNPKDKQGLDSSHSNYDATSLYIPPKQFQSMTDFEKQYWEIKSNYFDCIVFFQKGKFYELYELDALVAQQEFDLKISGGTGGRCNMKMAGVPESSLEEWVSKFVGRGYKVVQVDQREKTKLDSLVRREITMVHSSGTLSLDPFASYTCIYFDPFLLLIDASVATLQFHECKNPIELETILTRTQPKELVLDTSTLNPHLKRWFKTMVPKASLTLLPFHLSMEETQRQCMATLSSSSSSVPLFLHSDAMSSLPSSFWKCISGCLLFLDKMKLTSLFRWDRLQPYVETPHLNSTLSFSSSSGAPLHLDSHTLTHLQLLESNHPHSLMSILNFCSNPMGQRLLRQWICFPLTHVPFLLQRQEALKELRSQPNQFHSLKEHVFGLPDLARLLGRIQLKLAKPKEIYTFIQGFKRISLYLKDAQFHSFLLTKHTQEYPDILTILNQLESSYQVEMQHVLPLSGVHLSYDELNLEIESMEDQLHDYVLDLKQKMKLNSLCYVHMGKDSYQLEVPGSTKVPKDWLRVSATKKVIRYHTPFIQSILKSMELKQTLRTNVLRSVLMDVYDFFQTHAPTFQKACEIISELDVYQSLVTAAETHHFHCLPKFQSDSKSWIQCEGLRHPCYSNFIPNALNLRDHPTIVLTGPNMGGKSTLLRTIGVSVVLAQLGMWLPADTVLLSPYDAIYTRMGAKDHLMQHMSTFFVELNETASILRHVTSRSLVLMDELGRGTGTYDGNAIAFGVLVYVLLKQPSVLFATHYPLDDRLPVYRMYMDYLSSPMTFLYKLVPGTCPSSLGTEIARLAGLPDALIAHAQSVSKQFEQVKAQHSKVSLAMSSNVSLHSKALGLVAFALNFNQHGITLTKEQLAILKTCLHSTFSTIS